MSYVSPMQTECCVYKIADQILNRDKKQYSCVIAPVRGGLIPGVMLSHALNIPLFPVSFSLRDFKAQEDIPTSLIKYLYEHSDQPAIVIDDIVDSGATFDHLLKELADTVPEIRIDSAALIYNIRAPVGVHYYGFETDRDEYQEFFHFFWEL